VCKLIPTRDLAYFCLVQLKFATGELQASSSWMRAISSIELKETVKIDNENHKIVMRYIPLGMAVGIVPWNVPVIQVLTKIAPALITDNPIVIKPSSLRPYCALKLGELAQQFFPPGAVHVLSGGNDLGPILTSYSAVAKVSFTGSSASGKKVIEMASRILKRVTLKLGGNDPAIILPDVNIAEIVNQVNEYCFHLSTLKS